MDRIRSALVLILTLIETNTEKSGILADENFHNFGEFITIF